MGLGSRTLSGSVRSWKAVMMDGRFCVNVAVQSDTGYTELKPADYTVECLVS